MQPTIFEESPHVSNRRKTDFIPALGISVLTPFYDLVQRWLVRDWIFKSRLIAEAEIAPGQRVLDVGCGTGTLAIMVRQAQPGADVTGLDADPRMLKVARAKAAGLGLNVHFDEGMAHELPYPDASFDRVLSSLMIHHLKTPDKERLAREVQRVLKPGGRMHVIDFCRPYTAFGKVVGPLLHAFEEADDNIDGRLPVIFGQAGLYVRSTGGYPTFFGDLEFLRGEKV
jgi:ubiquinone/menaquinone biosynthesis C-methylase UbiE